MWTWKRNMAHLRYPARIDHMLSSKGGNILEFSLEEVWNPASACLGKKLILTLRFSCIGDRFMPLPWDSKKLHFLASCSRLSFLSQEATSRSLFFWLPATFFSFLAHFWCSRSLIFRLLGPRSSFLAQEAASWKLASWKPKKPILEAKKTSFLNSPRSYFLKSKKLVFLASRKHVKLKMFWFKV